MKNIFSMDDSRYFQIRYFNPIFDLSSYRNIIFIILFFPLSLSYLIVLLPLLLSGVLLLVIWIGVPVLVITFKASRSLADFNRWFINFFFRDHIEAVQEKNVFHANRLSEFLYYARDPYSWKVLAGLIIQPLFSLISFLLVIILVVMSFLMIYTPFRAIFGHIQILSFYQTDSFIEAVVVFFIGILLWTGMLNIINFWTGFSGRVLRWFMTKRECPLSNLHQNPGRSQDHKTANM